MSTFWESITPGELEPRQESSNPPSDDEPSVEAEDVLPEAVEADFEEAELDEAPSSDDQSLSRRQLLIGVGLAVLLLLLGLAYGMGGGSHSGQSQPLASTPTQTTYDTVSVAPAGPPYAPSAQTPQAIIAAAVRALESRAPDKTAPSAAQLAAFVQRQTGVKTVSGSGTDGTIELTLLPPSKVLLYYTDPSSGGIATQSITLPTEN